MVATKETTAAVRDVEHYKYGFVTDIDSDKAPKGLNESTVCFISAKKKLGISSLFKLVVNQNLIWKKRISTGKLNNWINGLVKKTPPPLHKGRSVKFKYITRFTNTFLCKKNRTLRSHFNQN